MTTPTTTTGAAETATGAAGTGSPVTDPAVPTAGTTAAEPGHGGGGLPQLNPDHFAPQLVWLAITFALLYLLLSRLVIPRISGVIGERKGRIDRDLAEAERLKSETKKAIEDYDQAIAEARGSAHKLAQDTRDKLKSEVDGERARVEKELADRGAAAEAAIAKAKSDAMAEVGGIAAETAETILGQLIGARVARDESLAAVEAARSR